MAFRNNQLNSQTAQTLTSWRAPACRRRLPKAGWWGTGLACLGLVALWSMIAAPFQVAKTHIVLLVPPDHSATAHMDDCDSQTLRLERLVQQAQTAFESLSSVEGFVETQSNVFQSSTATLASTLNSALTARGPIVIYASGILHETPQGYQLCASTPLAKKDQGLLLSSLLAQLEVAKSKACIVCIEVYCDRTSLSATLAPGLDLIRCRQAVEAQLKSFARRPLAVVIASAEENLAADSPSLAQAIVDAMDNSVASSTQIVTDHSFVDAIAQARGSTETWFSNNSWRQHPVDLNLPRRPQPITDNSAIHPKGSVTQIPVGKLVSFDASTRSSLNPLLTASAEQFARQAAACESAQLLDYCWVLHRQWAPSVLSSPLANRSDFTLVDSESSFAELAPAAWLQFTQFLNNAEQAIKLTPNPSRLHSDLHTATLAVAALDASERSCVWLPLDPSAPNWAKQMWSIGHDCATVRSVSRSIFSAAECSEGETLARQRLVELLKLQTSETSEAAGRAIIDSWQAPEVEQATDSHRYAYTELDWAQYYLRDETLPWNLRQSLLRNKLLSMQLLVESRGAVLNVSSFATAEQIRLATEQNVARKFDLQWQADAKQQTEVIWHHLRICQRYLAVRSQAIGLVGGICRDLPIWDRVLIPSESRQVELDTVCQCVAQLSNLNQLLLQNDSSQTSEMIRQMDDLTHRQQSWLAIAESTNPLTIAGKVDMVAFMQSPLPCLEFRRAAAQAARPICSHSLTHAQIYMRIQRQIVMFEFLGTVGTNSSPSVPNVSLGEDHRAPLKQSKPDDKSNYMLELDKLVDEMETTTAALPVELDPLEDKRRNWIEQYCARLSSNPSHRIQTQFAIQLLLSLEPDLQGMQNRIDDLAHVSAIEHYRAQAKHCIAQLKSVDQRAFQILRSELEHWNQLLANLGQPELTDPVHDIALRGLDSIDLSSNSQQNVPIQIANLSACAQPITIQVHFNSQLLTCRLLPLLGELNQDTTGEENRVRIAPDQFAPTEGVASGMKCMLPPNSVSQFNLQVSRTESAYGNSAIVLQMETESGQRQHVMRSLLADKPLVSLRLVNRSSQSNAGDYNPGDYNAAKALFANRASSIGIELRNEQTLPLAATVRLLASERKIDDIPTGAIPSSQLDAWLAGHPLKLLVDRTPTQLLQPQQTQAVSLPPQKLDPLAAPQSANQLLLVVSASGADKSQIFAWSPLTARPSSYVKCDVSYDAHTDELKLRVALESTENLPNDFVRIEARFSGVNSEREPSYSTLRLNRQLIASELLLKPTLPATGIGLLQIDIDGWPNAFVYRVDTTLSQTAVALATDIQAIRVSEPRGVPVLDTADRFATVEVDTAVSDGHFSPSRDAVYIGLDHDLDRTLRNEGTTRLVSPVNASIVWQGCTPDGSMLLASHVSKSCVELPIAASWNENCAILACVERGDATLWSNSYRLTIDHQPPQVTEVRRVDAPVKLLGKPIEVLVRVDDRALAGVKAVQGAWSLSGGTEILPTTTLVDAVRLQPDAWSLVLPTNALRSGSTLLLVRAIDQAGNISPTHTSFVEVLDEAGALRKQQSITTNIEGRVMFGSQPLPDLKLELLEDDASSSERHTTSDAMGAFSLSSIPSGNYRIVVTGLVRGMKTNRSVPVQVAAPHPPSPILFRLDRSEADSAKETP